MRYNPFQEWWGSYLDQELSYGAGQISVSHWQRHEGVSVVEWTLGKATERLFERDANGAVVLHPEIVAWLALHSADQWRSFIRRDLIDANQLSSPEGWTSRGHIKFAKRTQAAAFAEFVEALMNRAPGR